MKTLSRREKFLVPLLPAALLLLGYGLFGPGNAEINQLETRLERATNRMPDNRRIVEKKAELRNLRQELSARAPQNAGEEQSEAKSFFHVSDARRMEASMFLSSLLEQHGLLLLEERLSEQPEDILLPKGVGVPDRADLWELRFAGRFSATADFLGGLAGFGGPLLPLGLAMETDPASDSPIHTWRLWLWR